MKYDILILGSGPGGYVAAIRASQLGMKTAVIEKDHLGGICLNWGCIPTKALLKSAQVHEYIRHASEYGIQVDNAQADFCSIIERSRGVADSMSKGVAFLMKKNKIDIIEGFGKLLPGKSVEVTTADGEKKVYSAEHIIIATGARARELPHIPIDGERVIGYKQALNLPEKPETMIVMGSGAIGVELAYFYNSMGTKVHIVEYLPRIVPLEDEEISRQFARSMKKQKIKISTSSKITAVTTTDTGVKVSVKTKKGTEEYEADVLLSAVGIKTNIENIGLEEVGILTEKDKIQVNDRYMSNIEGYYAIGDVIPGPALAHVASAEGIACVEMIAGIDTQAVDYDNIPACTYAQPEIASVGLTEKQALEQGYEIKVGKFPFTASGKAKAAGHTDGFVKVIFDAKYDEWLGCHMIGSGVTDMISEAVVARKLETTAHDIIKSIHPHPTMSEAIMEAVAAAYDEVIHL